MQLYHPETAESDREMEFVPFATDRPVGLDLDEFLPVRLLIIIMIIFFYTFISFCQLQHLSTFQIRDRVIN